MLGLKSLREQKDGGPAYPQSEQVEYPTGIVEDGRPLMGRRTEQRGGLSKREWFAGLAMQGILAADIDFDRQWKPEDMAKNAVEAADALLAELAKNE